MAKYENSERTGITKGETFAQLEETKRLHIHKLQERIDGLAGHYDHIINANEMREEDLRAKCVQLQTLYLVVR